MTTSGHSQPSAPPAPPGAADLLCAGLVLLTACLLASFPARNSDVWAHLAAGRALAQGDYQFGPAPFAHTTADTPWVNPSWLYDLLSYGVYEALGGVGLVGLKALLMMGLCGALLYLSARVDWHWAAVCTALAVLAMGPYLALRPACVSYLFLGLTLWWLEKTVRSPAPADVRGALRASLPLLGLFVLWVNLDEWFLLGPLAVGLYLLGAALGGRGQSRAELRTLAVAFAAGLAACLVNPYHVRALALPEVLLSGEPAPGPEEVTDLPLSPFQARHFTLGLGLSPGGLAYYALVLLGLASFAAAPKGKRGPRAVLWLALLGLSAYRVAGVPFFAVVAGPIAALNFQEWAPRRAVANALDGLRPLVVLLLLALAVTAWPGWLQPGPPEPRRWAVEADPSLEMAARAMKRWHQEGRFAPQARGFNLSPASANYFAWACPAEKGFLDGRRRAFPPEVTDRYRAARGALLGLGQSRGSEWQRLLRDAGVTHLILYDRQERLLAALGAVLAAPGAWNLVGREGGVAVFARADASAAVKLPRLDLEVRGLNPPEEERAPRTRPPHDPEPHPWWEAFWRPRLPPAPGRGEALISLAYFRAAGPYYVGKRKRLWADEVSAATVAVSAPGLGLAALCGGVPVRAALLDFTLRQRPGRDPRLVQDVRRFSAAYLRQGDDGPPGALLGAVRAARRALYADPDDPLTHLVLGEAYLDLLLGTRERVAVQVSTRLDQLRTVQAIAALQTAVRLEPNRARAHQALALLYNHLGYLDLQLEHLEKARDLARAAGPRPGESPEQFEGRLRALEEHAEGLGKFVRARQNQYDTRAINLEVWPRAEAARQTGLAKKALEVLTRANYTDFGIQGADLQLQLLLATGRLREARNGLKAEYEGKLPRRTFRWLQILLAAATGDYAQADADLDLLTAPPTFDPGELVPPFKKWGTGSVRQGVSLLVGRFALTNATDVRLAALDLPGMTGVGVLTGSLREQAELLALRGLLALEQGSVDDARRQFRAALDVWRVEAGGALGLAPHYLKLLDEAAKR
jgi:tetratricopeptide (TPR) repeat protein